MKKLRVVKLIGVGAMLMCLTGCTANCERSMKTYSSNFGGGLNRTVTVYSNTGEEIRSWTGKFDVTDSENETSFDINGKRVIIQGGIVINEEE